MSASGEQAAAGFVLAGGQSSRMGSDKALILFRGQPLIQIALGIFAQAQIPARIAGARSDLDRFAEVVPDTVPSSGPLGGIQAALAASSADWNIFLPVDMPLIPASLLACLLTKARLSGAPITAARLNGRLEPFPVVLHRSALPAIENRLSAGKRTCRAAWEEIPLALDSRLDAPDIEHLVESGQCAHLLALPPHYWFQSANTAAELEFLNSLAASQPSGKLGT
jgi:molybdopterin-guanine dinucleotide biosynthesis protein A